MNLEFKIAITGLMFFLLFVGAIKFHGEEEPPFSVKKIEVIGALSSGAVCFIFMLIAIWIK